MENKITGAIIVAAGEGIRSKSTVPKQYLNFGHKMVLEKNIENFIHEPLIDFVLVVINEKHIAFYNFFTCEWSCSILDKYFFATNICNHS